MSERRTAPVKGPAVDLPIALRDRLIQRHGVDVEALEAALSDTPPTSIRLNPTKGFDPGGDKVPWCTTGRYLQRRPSFTFDPLFHAGCYYVQEASSMLLEQALLHSGMLGGRVAALDLCAAPGGKSTHLRSLLHPSSLLVASEPDGLRRAVLQENCWKWGLPNVVIAAGLRPRAVPEPLFDLVLVDAPCSGEGMFRKDPQARQQWSEGLVRQCTMVQQDLVAAAWRLLRPGGIMVYSTCTWEESENEARVCDLMELGAELVPLTLPSGADAIAGYEGAPGLRCYPHRLRGEGFYLAMVRKPGAWHEQGTSRRGLEANEGWRDWLRPTPNGHHGTVSEGIVHVVDGGWSDLVRKVDTALRVVSPGIPVAASKGPEPHPLPALALNNLLRPGAFAEVHVDGEQALRYLRGEALEATGATGFALLRFDGHALGWLKGAGRRWNNHWPAPWRIRSNSPQAERVSWTAIKGDEAP